MSALSKERRNKIEQEMLGWTPRRIQGYVDGGYCRRSGLDMPESYQVEMDEYCKGFRDGYFEQVNDPVEEQAQLRAAAH